MVNARSAFAAVLALNVPLLYFHQSMQEEEDSRPCAVHNIMEKKFGIPFKFKGYDVYECLGRGAQGETWVIKDAIVKIIYNRVHRWQPAHSCRFAKGLKPRAPEHFVNCLGHGLQELDNVSAYDPNLPIDALSIDCDICPGSALVSKTPAGTDPNRGGAEFNCWEAQEFMFSAAGAVMGCEMAKLMWSQICCSANGDFKYNEYKKSNFEVAYAIEEKGPGKRFRSYFYPKGVSEVFTTLDDILKLMLQLGQIVEIMMGSTEEDPAEFYYVDMHLGNVLLTAEGKITMIDYGSSYMCCNHSFTNATSKCGDLPVCDRDQRDAFAGYSNTFIVFDFLVTLIGNSDINWARMAEVIPFKDYMMLCLPKILLGNIGDEKDLKDLKDLTPIATEVENFLMSGRIMKPYLNEIADLGDLWSFIFITAVNEMINPMPSYSHPIMPLLKTAREWLNRCKDGFNSKFECTSVHYGQCCCSGADPSTCKLITDRSKDIFKWGEPVCPPGYQHYLKKGIGHLCPTSCIRDGNK